MTHELMRKMNRAMFKPCSLSDSFIKGFYLDNAPILLPESKRRHYRLRLRDGTMVSISRKISKPAQLQKICVKLKPVAVYQSVSKWLVPEVLSGKGSYGRIHSKSLSNNFLRSDFLLDLDKEHCTKSNVLKAYDAVRAFDNLVVKTGNGFHFWAFNPNFLTKNGLICDPFNREYSCLDLMVRKTNELRENGLLFDFKISCDTRRIARVPNTLHENGSTITILDSHQLTKLVSGGEGAF